MGQAGLVAYVQISSLPEAERPRALALLRQRGALCGPEEAQARADRQRHAGVLWCGHRPEDVVKVDQGERQDGTAVEPIEYCGACGAENVERG